MKRFINEVTFFFRKENEKKGVSVGTNNNIVIDDDTNIIEIHTDNGVLSYPVKKVGEPASGMMSGNLKQEYTYNSQGYDYFVYLPVERYGEPQNSGGYSNPVGFPEWIYEWVTFDYWEKKFVVIPNHNTNEHPPENWRENMPFDFRTV